MTSTTRCLLVTSVVAMSFACSGVARATILINAGYNLFQTVPVSKLFFGPPVPNQQFVDFNGNPLGTFDFGTGPLDVGLTDTIIERKENADLSSGSDTIEIELVALSLKSVSPVDLFGSGAEDVFIDLKEDLGSEMTIFDSGEGLPHGTFDSILDFSFDVSGSVGGYYGTFFKTITASGQEWQHAPTGSVILDGINHRLNSSNQSNDFWPHGLVIHDDGSGEAIHTAASANIPEPSSALLLGVSMLGVGLIRWKRRT